jgi:hypothetical protein
MSNWITGPLTLRGETIDLISLKRSHLDELKTLAKEKKIWEFYPIDISVSEKFNAAFESAFKERVGISFHL